MKTKLFPESQKQQAQKPSTSSEHGHYQTEPGFETRDLPYVHFFMNQMGNYLWFAGITSPVTRHIMAKALEQPVLQHAVLCTSAALLSERNMTGPVDILNINNIRWHY